jgi:hypothetical protein
MPVPWPVAIWICLTQIPVSPAAVRGVVVDAQTAAPIADARVVLVEARRSVQTGGDGRFDLEGLAPGSYTLTVSLIGYTFVRRQVDVAVGTTVELTIPLTGGTGAYQETVSVKPAVIGEVGVGSQQELGSGALQDLRGIAADDPMRAMQALPGVATGDDFQSQFSVRGSEFRHVGVVIDGTATPFLLHTVRSTNDTGSIAMINSDVLDRASLMAGAHPQRHGDWLGATLDFGLREGSRDQVQLRGAASATTASLVLEGPVGRARRGSWLTSIRKSYIDWLIRKIYPSIDGTLGFSDLQSKIAYDVTPRQQVQFAVIAGDAAFRNDKASAANGIHLADSKSVLASTEWRYTHPVWLVSQRLSFVGSRFQDLGLSGQELGRGYARSVIWRGDVDWFPNKVWTVQAGGKVEGQHQTLTQRNFALVGGKPQARFVASDRNETDLDSGWGQLSRRTARSGFSIGTRVTTDTLSGRTIDSPWVLGERTAGSLTFRASTGISHQFPELEIQRGLTERIPERAEMVDLGVEGALPQGMRWQATAFGRRDVNVVRRTGEDRLVGGKRVVETTFPQFASSLNGTSRGLDLLFGRRATSGLTGWVSYTYARTPEHDRITSENFDGDFDQRHTLNVFVQERLSYRTAISLKLRAGSNVPMVGYFQGAPDALRLGAERNQVRLPNYVRLDLRANHTFTFTRRRLTLFVEVVNATNRTNLGQAPGFVSGAAFTVVNETQKLLPFLPSVGILIEF